MEIIQKPDSLSLLGNLKKFLISSNAEVDFSLSVSIDGADVSLLQESYTPDSSGNISIDIREVCGQYLKTNLPSDNVFLQSDALRTFTATIGSSSWSFTVVNASVRNLTLSALEYLQYNFLTLQPQSKQVSWHSPEYLTYYFTEQADVQAKFYLKSGGTEIVTVATISPTPEGGSGTIQLVNKVYTINTSLSRLMALSSHDTEDLQGIVDVWVQGSVSRLSYIQRYVYAPSTGEEHHYFAVNSLGGIDTFTFIGEQKITGEIEHQAAENDDKKITVTSGGQRKYRQNTGYLGEASSEWLWEFLHSSRQWAVVGAAAEELVVVSSSLSQGDLTNLNSSSFDFLLARDGGLLPESRRDETFPDITVPSPVSDLFFLNPRIIDFPAAPSDAELVFPVQTPYSNEWSYLTLQELQERLSIAASLNHTHRNLSVLQALGESNGQLTYRGVVIGSGGGISLPIAISDVEGLSSILNNKAKVSHSHRWADITDRPTRLTDFTNNLVPSWALAIEKPSYNFSEIQNKPTTLSGYGITDGYSSLTTTGSGNAITGVSESGHALTFTKGNTFVDLASEQTISGKKHISYLDVTGAFAIPQVEPSAEAGKVFEYIDHSGSFGESSGSVTPADLKDLTLKINGVTQVTYNPSSAASFNVDLTSYATQSWVEAKNYLQGITKTMVENVLTGNITSHTHSQYLTSHQSLAGYATEVWVQQQGYLTSHQSLADYALKSEIPTSMAWSAITGRPTKLSQFTNDIISSWALAATKPSYSWSEIGSRPTTLASFSGDSTHRLVSDTQISNWNSAYGWGNHADAGYLTSFTESDPTVPAWAKAASKPSYSWSEIGSRPTKLSQFTNDILSDWALAATKPSYSWTEINSRPTTLSAFSDDATHRLVSDEQIASWDRSYGELIMGTQTSATGSWTGVSRLATAADMTSGYRFTYWLPYGGSGNASLTLTFGDGTTKTINLYIRGTSRLTTHYPAGTKIDFVYFENISIAGSSTLYTGAWPDAYYDSTIVDRLYSSYERTYLYSASDPLYRYKLCGFSSEGKIVPLTITNQTSGTIVDKTPTTVPLNPKKGIVYYNATTNITAATTRIGSLYSEIPMSTPHYTFNTSVPVDADIFLKGSYDEATGLFTLDTTSHTSWYVFALKSSGNNYDSVFVEGSCYMYVGPSSNTANYLQLKNDNPLYVFKNGKLISLELSALTTTWSDIVGRPIKLSDFSNDIISSWALAATKPSYSFSELNNKPTTISGYGITDAKIQNGTITLGSSTITPLTSFTETDPTVPAWAKAASKPAYNLDEVSDGSTRKLSDYMLSSSFTKSAITTLLGNDTFAPYNSNGYLPLNGGTLTGGLLLQANQTFDVSTAARSIYYTDSNNVSRRAMIMNPNGVLAIGYDLPSAQLNLQLDGYSTLLRFGSTKNYSLTLNGADGTIRSSVGANLVSLGYRSGNTIYPLKHIYSTFNVSTKCIGAISGTVLYGVARFTIANTKKARTFAIKIPSGTNATTFKIIIYSSYNTCPSSTITVSTGGVNLTASAYCALYPSYSVEGSFAGRVAFARDGNTSDSHMYILLGCYNDGQQYQSGMIAIDSIIHSSQASVADTVMNFGYELLDLDSESMFTKITECVNADAHFKSVSVTEHVTAPKIDCTNMFLVPTSEPSSVPAGKVAEYIDLTGGSFAN